LQLVFECAYNCRSGYELEVVAIRKVGRKCLTIQSSMK